MTPPTTSETWLLARAISMSATAELRVYARAAPGSEPASQTWAISSANTGSRVTVFSVSGGNGTVGTAQRTVKTDNTHINTPAASSPADNAWIGYYAVEASGNGPAVNWPAGVTEVGEWPEVTGSSALAHEAVNQVTAGTIPLRVVEWTAFAGDPMAVVVIVVEPSTSGGGSSTTAIKLKVGGAWTNKTLYRFD